MGSAAISAQNAGVAVATNNTANANTEGYSRQSVGFNASIGPPVDGGVTTGATTRYASDLLSTRIRANTGSLAQSTQSQLALSDLENTLTSSGTIDTKFAALFNKIATANATPTDSVARDAVVQATRDLGSAINTQAKDISDAQHQADLRITDNVPTANSLITQLAASNKLVAQSNDPTASDKRDLLAKQLSEMVGGTARIDKDGQMRFVLDNGAVLVDGTHAAKLATTNDPTTGYTQIQVKDGNNVRDVTSSLGGKISADVSFRDVTAKNAADALDRVAYNTAVTLNGVHSANAALDGSTGHNMYIPPFVVSGAAAALKIDPQLDADSANLALGTTGAGPGDNRGGQALYALASANVSNGKTFTDASNAIIADVGAAGSAAKNDMQRDQLISDNLAGLRDSFAGVDTQEELTNLARFEHA
ncbi:MAG TPA: flagellar hook-associated protein FlgK, partial [Kofleriaceae bacterium]